ncbi:MAG TPA: S8 family serine peptidase, partial [Dehalococcoidia bacterium]|nr:S8 family serine peptidase [Dehalococcoidia bacterium]
MLRTLLTASLALTLLMSSTTASAGPPSTPPPPEDEEDLPLVDRDRDRISDGLQAILEGASSAKKYDVIVTFSGSGAAGRSHTAATESKAQKEYKLIPAFRASLNEAEIQSLSKKPGVVRIEENKKISLAIDAANRDFGTAVARQEYGVDGTGVGICVIDTGADRNHEQLDDPGKIAGWIDYIGGQALPYDDHGHGTHVASIAAGSGTGGSSAFNLRGVAPKATLYIAKVFDALGGTDQSEVIEAIEWCAATPGVDIISMSLATTEGSDGLDALSQAASAAADAGKIVVSAAGNAGDRPGTVGAPGAAEKVITVGAAAEWTATSGAPNRSLGVYLAPFSSRGPTLGALPRIKPDIVAPGVTITAADAGTAAGYVTMSGTSMATPFAAGALALAVEAAGGSMSNAEAKSLLQDTAADRGASGKDNDFGWGLLDGFALVAEASGDSTYEPNDFPDSIDIAGEVPDSGLWRMTFDVSASDLDTPIAATVIVDGEEDCSLFIFGFCLIAIWDPDLAVRLVDPTGVVLDTSDCQTAPGDCGNVGRQETVNAMPTVAGTYKLEVTPVLADPNAGQGGEFTVSLSNGTLDEAGVITLPPLIGHWAFDDGAGTVATDSSDGENHGTLVNGPLWRSGIVGGALDFDGNDDRVTLPGLALDGVANMTLTLWVQTTKTGEQTLVGAAGSGNANEMLLHLQSATQVRFYTGESGSSFVSWNVPSLADGAW